MARSKFRVRVVKIQCEIICVLLVTAELLRRRTEHNDGDLESLEELSLHQQELEK